MSMNEHEFYKRSFFDKISDYKISIIFIILLFIGLTFVYLFFAKKVYRTDATLEIVPKYNLLGVSGENRGAEGAYERHFVTQMDFLKSRYLISKVVKSLQANISYYQAQKYKPFKLLQTTPPFYIKDLHIKDDDFYEKMFHIELIDDSHYALRLVSKTGLSSKVLGQQESSALIYQFSKPVISKYMNFTIERNRFSKGKDVYFKVQHERSYVDSALSKLTVMKNSSKSSIIKISYDDYSPKSAQKFVNGLLREYMSVIAINQAKKTDGHLKLLDYELSVAKKKLDDSEKRLQKFIEQNRVAGIGIQTTNMINTIYKYESELENLDILYQNIKAVSATYKKSDDYKDILTRVSQLGNANLIKLVDSITADESRYKTLRKKYKSRHPKLIQLKRDIAQKSLTLKKNLKQIQQNTESKRRKLKRFLSKYKSNLTTVPRKEIGYAKLKREHDLLEKNYLLLLDKKTQITVSKKIQGDYNYKVLDYAFLPEIPAKPKKSVLMLLGTILGMAFGLLYAMIRAYFAKKITVPSEVEELTRLPYLGTIPYIKDKNLYNDLFVAKEPNSIASQMMWSLRDRIDGFGDEKKSKIIAITSMVKGEGKTTLAANLAMTLGMGDKKTIVLSLDLRLPEIHAKFGINNDIGLSSVLFGNKKLSEVVYQSNEYDNLYVIPSGPKISNPMKIINSNYIDYMLQELKERYDYIVIDLPPAGVAAESVFLMKKADLVISVLKSKYSEKSFILYTESIAEKNNIKNLGFVLNGVNKKYIKIIARKENLKYINRNKSIAT